MFIQIIKDVTQAKMKIRICFWKTKHEQKTFDHSRIKDILKFKTKSIHENKTNSIWY